ncbi:MAG: methionine gamma-lyase family protein [Clostridia bacterium]|nr:methionine gamma-lyase family protein [Clostridia bacterium]
MNQPFFNINSKIVELSEKAIALCAPSFSKIEEITEYNQLKVLKAFADNRVSERHFAASTGYGYGDEGRETLDAVFAQCMGAPDAIIRHNFVCGTQALTVALFGMLRPGDAFLSVTGMPYDTLRGVIGITGEGQGSLKDFGIEYRQLDLLPDGKVDIDAMPPAMDSKVKMVYIQRSRGYTLRPSLSVSEITEIAHRAKQINPDVIVMVDNCYGEFVEKLEPVACGADIMAGSLIKNPGGGIAPTGGYICGRSDLVELCSYRLTTPGTGREVGCSLGHNRELFMGLYNAPHVTGEALKTAVFASALFELLGFEVTPRCDQPRADIIQAIMLRDEPNLIAFCQGVQRGAPVDSFVIPEPWDMPGYDSKVIMAAGAFTLGSSIELSADAPLREPYAVWMQGGLNFNSGKMGITLAAQTMLEKGLI